MPNRVELLLGVATSSRTDQIAFRRVLGLGDTADGRVIARACWVDPRTNDELAQAWADARQMMED